LERLSGLVGTVEVREVTASYERQRLRSESVGLREKKTLRPEEIRTLPDGHALVVFRNAPAVIVRLRPWFQGPDAERLRHEAAATAARRRARSGSGSGAGAGAGESGECGGAGGQAR
jgi:type IV secretory pathway TraG/TraD family ATPase VirD4